MRAYQVFGRMPNEQAVALFRRLAEHSPAVFQQAVAAAAGAMRARPVFLQRKPFEQKAEHVRRALARVAGNDLAEELLAVYFLEVRKPLLVEWLDTVGLAHEEGALTEDAPEPPPEAKLADAVKRFRDGDDPEERELLLRAFAAQSAIRWPALDRLLEPEAQA